MFADPEEEEAIELARAQLAKEALNQDTTTPDQKHQWSQTGEFAKLLRDMRPDDWSGTDAFAGLTKRINVLRENAAEASGSPHNRAVQHFKFARKIFQRFLRIGNISDLDDAIVAIRQSVELTSPTDPRHPDFLNRLGIFLAYRHRRTAAMADLQEAIRIGRTVLEITDEDDVDRPLFLSTLADHLSNRYQRIGNEDDFQEANKRGRAAIEITTISNPGRPAYLNTLGTLLGYRYSRTKDFACLEETIETMTSATIGTPKGSPEHALRLDALGKLLTVKYEATRTIDDLENAIETGRVAVDETFQDHPGRAIYLLTLASQLGDRFEKIGDSKDLEDSLKYAEHALNHVLSPIKDRILAGIFAISQSGKISDWERAYEAADTAVQLIPKLLFRSLDNADKQYIISQVVGLGSKAAAAALNAKRSPSVSLQLLEQARGVLATSLEDMRSDISELEQKLPTIAEQFMSIRGELDQSKLDETILANEQENKTYDMGIKFDRLVDEIRSQPGFEDFLGVPKEEDLCDAAEFGPIVVINVCIYRCDAIVVESDKIRCIQLSQLFYDDVHDMGQERDLGSPKILEWLWDTIVSPVLDTLGYSHKPSDNNWPRVWWIPTGPLSRFSLHAAGYHHLGSGKSALDRVMPSYSSSIKAIMRSRQRNAPAAPLDRPEQALFIAMENTPGCPRLEFARKEVANVKRLLESARLKIIEPQAQKKDVVFQLPNSKFFHFAGHGQTCIDNPLDSQLLLEDWKSDPLTVGTLLKMNLRDKAPFVAYLSACGTGRIQDEKFFDESVHLISASQLAGFRHVIGTLWEVNDEICGDMAEIIYEGIISGGMTDVSVCLGLHNASRQLRDRWLKRGEGEFSDVKRDMNQRLCIHGNAKCRGTLIPKGDDKLSRNIIICYSEAHHGSNIMHPATWVPYVHFGV